MQVFTVTKIFEKPAYILYQNPGTISQRDIDYGGISHGGRKEEVQVFVHTTFSTA